jgi:hypothetical protein
MWSQIGLQPAGNRTPNPLQGAVDAGIVSWNGHKPVFPPPIKLRGEGTLISAIVIEERG